MIAALAVYAAIAWWYVVREDERQWIRSMLGVGR
jgi:hypothetical protein